MKPDLVIIALFRSLWRHSRLSSQATTYKVNELTSTVVSYQDELKLEDLTALSPVSLLIDSGLNSGSSNISVLAFSIPKYINILVRSSSYIHLTTVTDRREST